jgi:hypothetical protein
MQGGVLPPKVRVENFVSIATIGESIGPRASEERGRA